MRACPLLVKPDFKDMMKTTIKIKLRFSHGVTTSGRIVYVVTKDGESRRISTGIPLRRSEWDDKAERAVMTEASNQDEIDKANEQIEREVALLRAIVKKLDAENEYYDFGRLHNLFTAQKCEMSLAAFMRQEIKYKIMSGHHGTARNYLTSLKSFLTFCNGVEVPVKTIASDMMEDYQAWLEERGVCSNTTSFYMRNLRAIYMRMVKEELTIDRHPFANVYTGVDKTRKRAIPEKDILKLKSHNIEAMLRERSVSAKFLYDGDFIRGSRFFEEDRSEGRTHNIQPLQDRSADNHRRD